MKIPFKIEHVFQITGKGYFVAAKCLDLDQGFSILPNSKLGNVYLTGFLDIPRLLDEQGNQRYDVFIFQLRNEEDKTNLEEGMIVDLE